MKNLTYDQLIKLAPKDRPFQIEVESNAFGEGGKQILWAFIDKNSYLDTGIFDQYYINKIDYSYSWRDIYTGTFTLIDPRYQKPEVLKTGQKVRIMESARKCGDYKEWGKEFSDLIGTIDIIEDVYDNPNGVYYYLQKMLYMPSYCVMPVEEKEIPERTLEDILFELSDEDKEIIRNKLK
jgi:hypothetical protein